MQVFGVYFIEVDLKGPALKKFHVIIKNIIKRKKKKRKKKGPLVESEPFMMKVRVRELRLITVSVKKKQRDLVFHYILIDNPL